MFWKVPYVGGVGTILPEGPHRSSPTSPTPLAGEGGLFYPLLSGQKFLLRPYMPKGPEVWGGFQKFSRGWGGVGFSSLWGRVLKCQNGGSDAGGQLDNCLKSQKKNSPPSAAKKTRLR